MRADEIVLDFETDYSSTYSVSEMGYHAYTHDDRFNAYLVGWADNESNGACDPRLFDWRKVHGKTIIAHNATFDWAVFDRLVEIGIVPEGIVPAGWLCSSAMAAYFQCERSLKGAALAILNEKVDKTSRTNARGTSGDDLFGSMAEYCAKDAVITKRLWEAGEKYWPEFERRLWVETARMGRRGIALDTAYLEAELAKLNIKANKALDGIPWHPMDKPTSPKALEKWCKFNDQERPEITDDDKPEFKEWKERNLGHPVVDVVESMQKYRSANRSIEVLLAMRDRLMPNGRMESHLMYYGAVTGRWSGGGHGLNLQNLNKDDERGDARGCLVPAPGHKFIVIDLAQIEARVLLWLAGDEETLQLIRSGMSVYESHARATMGWTGGELKKENKKLYALAKARCLGLGFGCGDTKFKIVAKTMAGLDLSFDECRKTVREYRDTNLPITEYWNTLQKKFDACDGGRLELPLPSGRRLIYRNVKVNGRDSTAEAIKGSPSKIYAGLLTENITQGVARDVFADRTIALIDAGFKPVMLVHDEWVIEHPAEDAESGLAKAESIIKTGPSWAKGLPIGCESAILERYAK